MAVLRVMKHTWLCTVWASFSIITNVESLPRTHNYRRNSPFETRKDFFIDNKENLFHYNQNHPLFPAKPSTNEDSILKVHPVITMYVTNPKVEHLSNCNVRRHEIKKKNSNGKRKQGTFGQSKHPELAEDISGATITQRSTFEEPLNNFGLSYLQSEEAKHLTDEPNHGETLTAHTKSPSKTYTHYLSDSADLNTFPRFNIPLRSLQLDAGQDSTYNLEASEIIEPTYIIPKNENNMEAPINIPSSYKSTTHGVSTRNGEFSRKEIRNDNGEYFSGYKDSAASSADVGSLVPTADGGQVLVRRGSYSFTSPEGLRYRVNYTADETGYHATQVPVQ